MPHNAHGPPLHVVIRSLGQAFSDTWYTLSSGDIRRSTAGLPEMELARRHDPEGLRTWVEIGLLAESDVCLAKSHLADFVASPIRSHAYGKRPCIKV